MSVTEMSSPYWIWACVRLDTGLLDMALAEANNYYTKTEQLLFLTEFWGMFRINVELTRM
jgi:hypothetical protein